MGIFDFLKKNKTSASTNVVPDPTPPKPAAPEKPTLVFPVAGEDFTLNRLKQISEQQPTWFWIDEGDGSTHCQGRERCRGHQSDAGFHPCRCGQCGYAVHLNLQPDFTCKVCGEKVSALDAVNTVNAYANKAVYDRSLWPMTIHLSSGLPALLAASIGPDGTNMEACERAYSCFCVNTVLRERWEAMQAESRLFPSQVESLFTAMLLHFMQAWQKKQPERNLFL